MISRLGVGVKGFREAGWCHNYIKTVGLGETYRQILGAKKQEPGSAGEKGLFYVVYQDRCDAVLIRLAVIVCFINIDFLADGQRIEGSAIHLDFGEACGEISVDEINSRAVAHGA